MPRTDPETSLGIVTDVCLKRKIRNFVELTKEGEAGYNILIKADKALNTKFTEAYNTLGLATKQKGKNPDDVKQARDYICQNYFDVRTFGAVMSTGDDPCGIVRGPVQLNFARSIDPVLLRISQSQDRQEQQKTDSRAVRPKWAKEHNPIRSLSWRGLCFRNARSEDNRL